MCGLYASGVYHTCQCNRRRIQTDTFHKIPSKFHDQIDACMLNKRENRRGNVWEIAKKPIRFGAFQKTCVLRPLIESTMTRLYSVQFESWISKQNESKKSPWFSSVRARLCVRLCVISIWKKLDFVGSGFLTEIEMKRKKNNQRRPNRKWI